MTTALAPSGITPPVKIRTPSPPPTVLSNGRPPASTADSASVTGISAKIKLLKRKLLKPKLLDSERGQRVRYIVRRCHVNGGQAPRPRAFDILGEIVKEHDTGGRYADGFHHMIIGRRIRLPKPDRGRQEHFAEMAEHIGIGLREMFDMSAVGIGEGVERQPLRCPRQQLRHARHLADKDGVPAFEN